MDTTQDSSQRRQVESFIPPTMSGVHRVVILGFICLRLGSLAQLGIALGSGSLVRAALPWLSASAALLLLVESVAICLLIWRGGRASRPDLVAIDVGFLCLLYLLQLFFADDPARAVTWQGWVFGTGVGFLIPIACLPSWRSTLLTAGLVIGTYWATVLPGAIPNDQAATVLANGSGLLVNVLGMRLVWVFLSRLGSRADAEAEAAREARAQLAEEHQRITHQLHSQTGSLVTFLRDFDPGRQSDSPEQLETLTETLWSSANRARSELDGVQSGPRHDDTLGTALQRAAREVPGVRVTCTTYQVDDVRVPSADLGALFRAVVTVLENVVMHAGAREATIYASRTGAEFEVTVTDTGAGFDPDKVSPGIGLGSIAGEYLAARGIRRTIRSAPDQGTTVAFAGVVAQESS